MTATPTEKHRERAAEVMAAVGIDIADDIKGKDQQIIAQALATVEAEALERAAQKVDRAPSTEWAAAAIRSMKPHE